MSRPKDTLKQAVELYLIIIGGAYTLSSAVALISNTQWLLTSTDRTEVRGLRSDIGANSLMLITAGLTFTAGVGIHKYRLWGLVLAVGTAILMVGYSLVQNARGLSDYHDFTIALPMALIFVWAILPRTWLEFKRKSFKSA